MKEFVNHMFYTAKYLLAIAIITLCSASAAALPLTWRADWPDAKPVETLVHRGTDIELQPTWFVNKAPADTNGWTFTTYCQTNAVGPWFGPLPGAAFSHTNDIGAASYNVMVRAQMPGGGINYTAFARLRMLDSPGFTPGDLPLPVSTIDFSEVVAINAPWLLPDATNGLVEAANDYTDAKVSSISAPDYSTGNTQLVATIEAVAPTPGNYAAVSNAAMHAVQPGELAAATNRLLSSARAYTDAATNRVIGVMQDELTPLQIQALYPDGSVTSAAELTSGIKYTLDSTTRTAMVKPFCNTGDSDNDNSSLLGRVVIPPFVDSQGNPYISDDGTRFKVVGVSSCILGVGGNLTSIIAPNTVTTIGRYAFNSCASLSYASLPAATNILDYAFYSCVSLTSVNLPAAQTIEVFAFDSCMSLTSVNLPAAQTIGGSAFNSCVSLTSVNLPAAINILDYAFYSCVSLTSVNLPAAQTVSANAFNSCESLTSVNLPAAQTIGGFAFFYCTSLASVDFGDTPRMDVPSLGEYAFDGVPTICNVIVPDAQYDAWIAANSWSDLVSAGYTFLRYSEWECARKYELDAVAAAISATAQNLATNYYTSAQTDDAIDALAAYYITSTTNGAAFASFAALTNATVYYSGGEVRAPTRNDYCVVLADETHDGAEWRYIYSVSVSGGVTNAQWEAQYPIETNDYEGLSNKPQINGVELFGDKTAAQLGLATSSELSSASESSTNYTVAATNRVLSSARAYADSLISATNTVFSNAVLSVGLGIDTNTVAAINALVEQGDELPISGATSVGALLLALAAAVAALKKGKAEKSEIRYDLPANATEISSASSEVVEGETVTYGEATLADRTANRVAITAEIAELRLTFPAEVSGKVRDFGLRVEVGTGSAALTAPALVPVAPTGETITLENADGAVPALADGTATAKGVTLLYFSETSPGVFLVKGEEVKGVA